MSNPNLFVDFFKNNLENIPSLLNELKQALEDLNAPINSENLFLFMNILYEICRREKENILDESLKLVATKENIQILQDARNKIFAFLSEEKDNIIHYMRELNKRKKKII